MVGEDALVTALVCKSDAPQVQDSGVLHHFSSCPWCDALAWSVHVGVVLHLCVPQQLLILAPHKGHGGGAAAYNSADETHVAAEDGRRALRLDGDLGFEQVV